MEPARDPSGFVQGRRDLIEKMDIALVRPGYWKLRLVRSGPFVPARIWLCDHEPFNEDNTLDRWPIPFPAGEVAGQWVDPREIWLRVIGDSVIWKRVEPIDERVFKWMMKDMSWAKEYAPDDPIANPRRPANLSQLPIPFLDDR